MNKKVVLIPLLGLLLAGCGANPPADQPTGENTTQENETQPKRKYTITFKDSQGNIIETKEVEEGQTPTIDYEPTDTEEYDYTLLGWATSLEGEQLTSLPVVSGDAVYYAVVSKIKVFISELLTKVNTELTTLETKVIEFIGIDQLNPLVIEFNQFCQNEINKALQVETKGEVESTLALIKSDIAAYETTLLGKLVDALKTEINNFFDENYGDYQNGSLKTAIFAARDTLIGTLGDITSFESLKTVKSSFKENVEEQVRILVGNEIALAKQTVKTAVDDAVNALLAIIPNETIKTELSDFYDSEIALIENTTKPDELPTLIAKVKTDIFNELEVIENKSIKLLVGAGIEEMDEVVNPILQKLPDGQLKTDILAQYNNSLSDLDAVDDLESAQTAINGIVNGTINFVKTEVEKVYGEVKKTVSDLIETATKDLKIDITDYLPEAMCPGYETNLVSPTDVEYDLSNSFVNVSDFKIGFGEQWNSVLETIDIVQEFLGYVNVGSVLSNGIAGLLDLINDEFNISTNLEYKNEFIKLIMSFDDGVLQLSGSFLKDLEIPVIGNVKPTIQIVNDTNNGVRTVKVKITDKNIIKYEIAEDKLQIAVSYGVNMLNKQTMLTIDSSGEETVGSIVDHTEGSLAGKSVSFNCLCDFYIGDAYVSVVGNKAEAMVASKGYINELYNKTTGKLLGYKIMEDLSFPLIGTKTYHTLWFNLNDINGIYSVKITDRDKNKCTFSQNDTFLNGSEKVMQIKQNGLASRYYDIELRNQYFYTMNQDKKLEKLTIATPMMFIQDNHDSATNFTDTPSEFEDKNNITISVTTPNGTLNKIRDDYDDLIPTYKEEVAEMKTANAIEEWLAE